MAIKILGNNRGFENSGLFVKADPFSPAFVRTGLATLAVKESTIVEVDGRIYTYHDGNENIPMPALAAGDDIRLWIMPNGQPHATKSDEPPAPGALWLGGAHFAPGGNAQGYNLGGDATPQFNPFSIWDQKYRPAAANCNGMARITEGGWLDIYPLCVDHHLDGTSKFNVPIANGTTRLPKIPLQFGGNGSNAYPALTWWNTVEIMAAYGKQLIGYPEFSAGAFGAKEGVSGGSDPVNAILRTDFVSIFGLQLITGNIASWGRDLGGPYLDASWTANTGGRGSTYNLSNAAVLGGSYADAENSGSRAVHWGNALAASLVGIGGRGRCDHFFQY